MAVVSPAQLKITILADLKKAMKESQPIVINTLRFFLAALKNEEIKKGKDKSLTNEEIQILLQQETKKRQEAVALYREGQRQDLASQEQAEAEILQRYLPPQLNQEEIAAEARKVIAALGASQKDFGRVMGVLTKKLAGRASGKMISEMVREQFPKGIPSGDN